MARTPRLFRVAAFLGALSTVPVPVALATCVPGGYYGASLFLPTGPAPLFFVVADFDADGLDDVAVTNSNATGAGTASVAVMLGNGAGAFGAVATYAAGARPYGLTSGDFDGNGALDLAAANWQGQTVHILLGVVEAGEPTGAFVPGPIVPAGGQPFQIVAADFDEDGILDLATALNDRSQVAVLRGLGAAGVGNGNFAAPVTYGLSDPSRAIATADVNGDDILDLVASEYLDGTVAVLRGQGAGGVGNGLFGAATHTPAGPEPVDIRIVDYDEDGLPDLAVANGTSGGVRLLRGAGNGNFTPTITLASGNTSSAVVVDVDQDGVLDVVAAETALPVGRRIHVFKGVDGPDAGNGPESFTPTTPVGVGFEPYQVAVASTNGDAYPDLLVSLYTSNEIVILPGGCVAAPPDPRRPRIADVRDVPADQGGRVYLTWTRSTQDVATGTVNQYRVWRRIPAPPDGATVVGSEAAADATAILARSEAGPGGELLVTFWEPLATLPAQRLEGYGYTAATTEDSTKANPVTTAFFVSALTSNIDVFYSSEIDSGASIDNLAPGAPIHFRFEPGAGETVRLAWSPNGEPDLAGYAVYRSPTAVFDPPFSQRVTTLPDTVYDLGIAEPDAYYHLTALDWNLNEGPPSLALAGGTVDAGDAPARLALAWAGAHPVRGGAVRLAVELPGDGAARLEVFDVAGRRVLARTLDAAGAGRQIVRLDAERPLASGTYWARLTHRGVETGVKLVVVD